MRFAWGLVAAGALTLSSTSQARVGTCAAGALRVASYGHEGGGGTESAYLSFELRRPGRCTVSGYPGVSLLDGRHRLDVKQPQAQALEVRGLGDDALPVALGAADGDGTEQAAVRRERRGCGPQGFRLRWA